MIRSFSIWGLNKKKPLATITAAHGTTTASNNWITAIASFRNSDLFATGMLSGNIYILINVFLIVYN